MGVYRCIDAVAFKASFADVLLLGLFHLLLGKERDREREKLRPKTSHCCVIWIVH